MKIEVLGTGCAKCSTLEKVVKEAIAEIDGFHSIEKVEDFQKILDYGVMSMPALVVDGVVKSTGKELNKKEVLDILEDSA